MKELISAIEVPTKPYVKEPEALLVDGTLVKITGQEEAGVFEIIWSLPSDVYPHRYCLKGWSFLCELDNLIIQE